MKDKTKTMGRVAPKWASGLFFGVLTLGIAAVVYMCLSYVAFCNDTAIAWLGFEWPIVWDWRSLAMTVAIMLLMTVWYECYYGVQVKRWRRVVSTCSFLIMAVGIVVFCSCKSYEDSLARSGVGTMQRALDIEYHQEDMKLIGALGFYGGQLKVDGEAMIYICREMDTFGPFDDQVLVDTPDQLYSKGYENYLRFEQDGLTQIRALSVQHYQDGYWLVVKRLANIDDLYIEIESLDDLQRYVTQMEYRCHTGAQKDLLREFEELSGEAVYCR